MSVTAFHRFRLARLDDAALLRAARDDREAFALFYRQHALAVQKWFAFSVESDPNISVELTAETFAEAIRSLDRFRGSERGSGTAWLFGIARNLAREHHRSKRVRSEARRELGMPVETSEDEIESIGERIDRSRAATELALAIERLSPAQQEAIRLRIVDELDYTSIAAATGTTEQGARLRVSRGLAALRAEFAPLLEEES